MKPMTVLPSIALVLTLVACGGGSSGGVASGSSSENVTNNNGEQSFTNAEDFFVARMAPRMDFCRTCHIPGGVADVEDGKRFMLSANSHDDYLNTQAAWQALGGGVENNRLIVENADNSEPHSGGKSWPVGSDAYNDMVTLLSCWDSPEDCLLQSSAVDVEQLPLLGSSHARHPWKTFCADQPDNAPLPVDPRTMIQPGINSGKAVFFNAWYENCHVNQPASMQAPTTCGEYRTQRDAGKHWFTDGGPTLVGEGTDSETYNQRWQAWGLSERPENFDEIYQLRYGANAAPYDNPYPLPGEDPNATNGGSGQLPQGLRQRRDANGKWTGIIGENSCFMCHGGQIGDLDNGEELQVQIENLGPGNNNTDLNMQIMDGVLGALPIPGVPMTLEQLGIGANLGLLGMNQRGQNNAVGGFELLFMITDYDSVAINPNAGKLALNSAEPHPTVEQQDTPPWWNYSHRSRKFFDAGVSVDATRIVMAAGSTAFGKEFTDHADANARNASTFITSMESPPYPGEIDISLAEEGAVLFHAKDLWAEAANSAKPRPLGGNGSCASCHGAYSPRYVNDPEYLETPALEGVAGHISPLEVIGTDRARADELTPYLRDAYSTTWWAFPEGQPGWVAPEDKNAIQEMLDDGLPPDQRVEGACGWERGIIGYQAPPLYGVWATAPYFHNGSVPTVAQVLDSSSRPTLWRRPIKSIGTVEGFDLSIERAYDHERLGWKHDVLACSDMPGDSTLNCNPVDPEQPSIIQMVEGLLNQTFNWSSIVSVPDPTPGGIDKRLIFDARKLGNSNQGHDFSDALTAREKLAIIEYLKTL
jgi:endo-cleaving rubber dioxygenase